MLLIKLLFIVHMLFSRKLHKKNVIFIKYIICTMKKDTIKYIGFVRKEQFFRKVSKNIRHLNKKYYTYYDER